jgi:HD-GYP domain-containing protein (c-di-GMP phosphodiesterase class II)
MTRVAQYLKPAWVRRLLELTRPWLPAGTSLALWLGGKRILAEGRRGEALGEDAADAAAHILQLDGRQVGALLLLPPAGTEAAAAGWATAFVFSLQGMLDAEHARRAVGQETLESYREMALLQRAIAELNRSLKPTAVARALLKEFEGQKNGADFGAVFLRDAEGSALELIGSFGAAAAVEFACLEESLLFPAMAESTGGDIIDDVLALPAWQGRQTAFRALLWLPLAAHDQKLGLLVLAARRDAAFSAGDMKRAQTLSAVAGTALRNAQLYAAEQEMFHAFVRVIATAIDAKSSYTAGHCRRVPEIALMLADAAHHAASGPFADFTLDEDERNALQIAAMLHDCGKVVTPEWVVDKATKLDAIVNRLELVAARFETLRRDAVIECLRAVAAGADPAAAERAQRERLERIDADLAFLAQCNRGGEFVSTAHAERIRAIAQCRWRDGTGAEHPVLSDDEVYNLLTPRGTLNPQERKIIEDHAVHTLSMLSQIPFPRSLRNVPEYAAGHHERIDGKGYPRGLRGEELSIPARIVAIADIFEALTAPDRPYRPPSTLSWAIDVMRQMRRDGHIDSDLFDLFIAEKIALTYAAEHLSVAQIDIADIAPCDR